MRRVDRLHCLCPFGTKLLVVGVESNSIRYPHIPAIIDRRLEAYGTVQVRRAAEKRQGIFCPQVVTIDWERIDGRGQHVRTEFQWTMFSGVIANEKIALLTYENGTRQMVFGREALDPANDWSEFVEFLRVRVGSNDLA